MAFISQPGNTSWYFPKLVWLPVKKVKNKFKYITKWKVIEVVSTLAVLALYSWLSNIQNATASTAKEIETSQPS